MNVATGIFGIVALVMGGFLFYVFTRKRAPSSPAADQKAQQLADAQAEVAKLVAEKGAEAAAAQIKQQYADEIAKLDAAQKEKADALAKDPAALVDLILRGS